MKLLVLMLHTFRELLAKATLIVLASLSTLILLGVGLSVSSTAAADGVTLTVFGNPASPPLPAEELSRFVGQMEAGLAGGLIAGIVLFGVFATASIIPETLERGTIDLYLSKPIARWELLMGRSLGAVAVIFVNIAYFIGALWLLFGLKLGVWNPEVLLSIPTLTLMFAALFSLVACTGVISRNTAISIIAAFLYLFIFGRILNLREQGVYLLSANVVYRGAWDGLFYLFPQLSALQDNIVRQIVNEPLDWKPFVQTFLSGSLFFAIGAYVLRKRDF